MRERDRERGRKQIRRKMGGEREARDNARMIAGGEVERNCKRGCTKIRSFFLWASDLRIMSLFIFSLVQQLVIGHAVRFGAS